jgi:hypothetical protein
MKATIRGVKGGKAIASNDIDDYICIELFSGQPEIEDVIQGDFETHGGMDIKNLTQNSVMSVFIQAYTSKESAEGYLRGEGEGEWNT